MRVLIACEESQVVCQAFRAKGHNYAQRLLRELEKQWQNNGGKYEKAI